MLRTRHVITLSHLDPDLHQWLKDEASRRSEATGQRVHAYEILGEGLRWYKAKVEDDNNAKGVSHEPY